MRREADQHQDLHQDQRRLLCGSPAFLSDAVTSSDPDATTSLLRKDCARLPDGVDDPMGQELDDTMG